MSEPYHEYLDGKDGYRSIFMVRVREQFYGMAPDIEAVAVFDTLDAARDYAKDLHAAGKRRVILHEYGVNSRQAKMEMA